VADTEYKYDIFPGTTGPTAYINNPRTYGATITVKL